MRSRVQTSAAQARASPATPYYLLSADEQKQPTIHFGIKNVVKFKLAYLVINYILRVWRWAKHSTSAY